MARKKQSKVPLLVGGAVFVLVVALSSLTLANLAWIEPQGERVVRDR